MQKMRALRWYGVKNARLDEVDVPKIGTEDVLLKVRYSTICATDRHQYYKGVFISGAPVTLGHEFAGEIVEMGNDVQVDMDCKPIEIGDVVAVEDGEFCGKCYYCKRGEYTQCLQIKFYGTEPAANGCFADYIRVHGLSVYKLLDGLTMKQGAMVEPTAVGLHAVRRGNVGIGCSVVILGAGAIGLLALQAAKIAGADKVLVSEFVKKRMDMAKRLGADVVINPIQENVIERVKEETSGLGADLVIEAVGSTKPSLTPTQQQGIDVLKKHGTLVIVGMAEEEKINFNTLITKELSIVASAAYSHWPSRTSDFVETMNLIKAGKINTDVIVTHEFTLDEWKKAFETSNNPEESIKVGFKF